MTCTSTSEGWRRTLYDMGIASIAVRDNTLSIWDYEITFDVWKAGHFTFTDATGDVYTKNCFFAGHDHRSMSIAFNSDDPRLVSVASSEKGPDAEPEPEPE